MTEQLRLGGAPSTGLRSPVTSETECGSAGSTRVVLVLVERPDGSSSERVELRQQNRTAVFEGEEVGKLASAVMKAIECSERRKARRAKP